MTSRICLYLFAIAHFLRLCLHFLFLPLWDGEVGKNIYFERRGSTNGGTRSFLRKNFAQTLHPDRKETRRSGFNKEFGIVHFEHQTIENTALPATFLINHIKKFARTRILFLGRSTYLWNTEMDYVMLFFVIYFWENLPSIPDYFVFCTEHFFEKLFCKEYIVESFDSLLFSLITFSVKLSLFTSPVFPCPLFILHSYYY